MIVKLVNGTPAGSNGQQLEQTSYSRLGSQNKLTKQPEKTGDNTSYDA